MTKYYSEICRALSESLREDETVICYGLGVTDPKGVFGTTLNLHKKYGNSRVFDTPTSENAMTGIGIGAAIMGHKVIMTHQRLDFFLLGIDQLVNAAAKLHYMYGGQLQCPITIRLIIGRGWGQGPTHSQSLQAWFAHIPGLKVVMPTFPCDAYNLLKEAIQDPNPVIFLEHRWLHDTQDNIIKDKKQIRIGESRICRSGKDYTVIATSYLSLEALKAAVYLENTHGLEIEVIDLVSIKPIDYKTIENSIKKTKRLCVVDSGFSTCSISSEIISYVSANFYKDLERSPVKLALQECPEPTSYGLTKGYYISACEIAISILKSLELDISNIREALPEPDPHDVPGDWFKGPF